MAFHRLYVDTDRRLPVIGVNDSSVAALPLFVQEATLALRVTLLAGFSRVSAYTPIPVAGITLEAALGLKIGNASLLYSQQFSWAASNDLADPYYEANFPMNTVAIAD